MQTLHQHRRETFLRLKDFANTHPDIPATTVWPQLVAELDSVISNLGGHAAAQAAHDGAALQRTDARDAARSALHEGMEKWTRSARAIAEKHPGFNEPFRLPIGKGDEDWINAAEGFVNAAQDANVKALFNSYGMAADFVEDLQHDIADLQSCITDQSGKVGDRKASGVNIGAEMDHGMSIKRQMDAVVHNVFHDRPDVLAEWETASHVDRGPKRRKATTEDPQKQELPKKAG